jgi:hypothetical protein
MSKAKGGGQWKPRKCFTLRTPKRVYVVFEDFQQVQLGFKGVGGPLRPVWRAAYRRRRRPWYDPMIPITGAFSSKKRAMAACRQDQRSHGDFWPKSKRGEKQ